MFTLKEWPLWTAVVTPFLKNGEIDYASFEKILKAQESAKNGILILGSTGEALNMSEAERRNIVEFTLKLNLSAPLMVGVGGSHLPSTQDWVRYLEGFKQIQTLLMVTPIYAKPGPIGQTKWFESLLNLTKKSCMLYNVPGRAACALSHQAVKNLKDHTSFWAIKEASGSTAEFKQYVEDAGGKPVYSGDDALLPDFAPLGCKGLVSVASNVWPKETHRYVDLCLAQKLSEAKLWRDCSNALFLASNPVPVKVLMHHLGQINHATLKLPLDEADIEGKMPDVLRAHEKIQAWWQNQKI